MSCPTMRGARKPDTASAALQSLMREVDAEASLPDSDGGAKVYGHYRDGRQYAIEVSRQQIEARGRMLADLEAEEARRYDRR